MHELTNFLEKCSCYKEPPILKYYSTYADGHQVSTLENQQVKHQSLHNHCKYFTTPNMYPENMITNILLTQCTK